jgi:hypothetical protein
MVKRVVPATIGEPEASRPVVEDSSTKSTPTYSIGVPLAAEYDMEVRGEVVPAVEGPAMQPPVVVVPVANHSGAVEDREYT